MTCYGCCEVEHIRKYCLRRIKAQYNQGYRVQMVRNSGGYGRGNHFGGCDV